MSCPKSRRSPPSRAARPRRPGGLVSPCRIPGRPPAGALYPARSEGGLFLRRPVCGGAGLRAGCSLGRAGLRAGRSESREGPARWRLPEVDELQREIEFLALDQGDHGLQVVLLLRGDAQFLALHLSAYAFGPLVPDDLADLLGVLLRDPLLEADGDPVLLAGELRLARVEGFQRHLAPDQLVLEYVEHRAGTFLAVRANLHGVIAGPADGRAHIAEIETGADLLGRLVERVVHLLTVDLADDVETAVRHHNSNPGDATFDDEATLPQAGVVDLRRCRAAGCVDARDRSWGYCTSAPRREALVCPVVAVGARSWAVPCRSWAVPCRSQACGGWLHGEVLRARMAVMAAVCA